MTRTPPRGYGPLGPSATPTPPSGSSLGEDRPEAIEDGTVGDYQTLSPSGTDLPSLWQEGLLVADRFRIVRFIGQGGMGKVYLAQDETLGRSTALKRVPQEIIFDADARDDLRQEANRLLDLAHENIVRIHTFYEGPTWPFFAMEYLQGPNLKKLLRTRKQYGRTFQAPEVLAIARQVTHGLSYAHAKGIIHRDLKPGNLMLAVPPAEEISDADVVKITDFGVSRVIAESTMRHTGKRSGTLPYMSPEQFHGEPCTVQSDVYSLACTLYELLSGQPPFHSGDIGYQIVHVPPKPLSGVPKPMSDAILRGLAKDPRKRFQSVDEFYQALTGHARKGLRCPPGKLIAAGLRLSMVLLALVVLYMVALLVMPETSPSPSVPPRGSPTVRTPGTWKQDLDEFVRRLREELLRQIPAVVGSNTPSLVAPETGGAALRFVMPEPTVAPQRTLFQSLQLQFYSQPEEEKPYIVGEIREGKKEFLLESLKEGTYTLKAYVELPDGGVQPLLDDDPVRFTLDLTGPSFRIEPTEPVALVSSGPPFATTFRSAMEFRLREDAGDLADIEEAHYKVEYGLVVPPWQKVDGPSFGFGPVALPPATTTTLRVYAVDAAGNTSQTEAFVIRRLALDVEDFQLVSPQGVKGNRARVRGLLRVEGEYRPELRYFVNGSPMRPEPGSDLVDDVELPESTDGLNTMPFAATLVLPEPTNTIEVRYSWRDNTPQPFVRPVQITDVKVKVPEILLAEVPAFVRTQRLRIEGRVEPAFEDLEIYLDQVGAASNRKLDLVRGSFDPPAATFSAELDLVPGVDNVFRFTCFYRKVPLEQSPAGFSVFCDTTPPRLADKIRFEASENHLTLLIPPLDDLQLLRVREIVGNEQGQWKPAELDLASFVYRYMTRLPQSPVTFQVELTDLAGNTAVFDQTFTPEASDPSVAVRPEDLGPEASSGATMRAQRSPPTWIVSPFLEEVGMEFVPFGLDRWEISTTEVPASAWGRFLREVKRSSSASVRGDRPVTLGEESPDLVREFVKWFEDSSQDGYRYDIPTESQWLMAFSGERSPALAKKAIRAWFQGELQDTTSAFSSNPRERYGQNTVLPRGSRPENRTPTGLLDMVSNVQELVREGELFKVIGGSNRDVGARQLEEMCTGARVYDIATREIQGALTGFRLCRRPAAVESGITSTE